MSAQHATSKTVKLLLVMLTVMVVVCAQLMPAIANANEKYAALVIDAKSGRVVHAENASQMRYPASLTKLMTLYMTFDALRRGKIHMNSPLRASAKAASMPSTNISLKKGDRLNVRDAIKALVVRSANDVAVVLAEELGGSEYQFARQMTSVANRLGMKNTTFRNASGLPDSRQKTTARDLAVLAMALRRHYPEYYHYFSVTRFKYKGRTYHSHNKVMQRVNGADGLKTGYIRASGFNLITSAKRNGKSIIAIIMGGRTSKSRDNAMVELVEQSFERMHASTSRKQFVFAEQPVPESKPIAIASKKPIKKVSNKQVAAKVINVDSFSESMPKRSRDYQVSSNDSAQYLAFKPSGASSASFKISGLSSATDIVATNTTQTTKGQFVATSYQASSLTANPAKHNQLKSHDSADWGIQVGAYSDKREALVAASDAVSRVQNHLATARVNIANTYKKDGKILHRARLTHLSKDSAERACNALKSFSQACFVYRENNI